MSTIFHFEEEVNRNFVFFGDSDALIFGGLALP